MTFYCYIKLFIFNSLTAEEEEIYLKAISDQIQVITKDLKTLEKAVYKKSDVISPSPSSMESSNLNEDILTKHLLKLNSNFLPHLQKKIKKKILLRFLFLKFY